ncbi:hypothetical protein SNEBB_001722 [Seison nebaliae]|nr:hypothetical protein SNEBB_001722 [Seison nebaliae]
MSLYRAIIILNGFNKFMILKSFTEIKINIQIIVIMPISTGVIVSMNKQLSPEVEFDYLICQIDKILTVIFSALSLLPIIFMLCCAIVNIFFMTKMRRRINPNSIVINLSSGTTSCRINKATLIVVVYMLSQTLSTLIEITLMLIQVYSGHKISRFISKFFFISNFGMSFFYMLTIKRFRLYVINYQRKLFCRNQTTSI